MLLVEKHHTRKEREKNSTRLTGSCLRSFKVLSKLESVGNSSVILGEVSGGTIILAVPGPDGFYESRCNISNIDVATIHKTSELGIVRVIPHCCPFLRSSYSWHIVDVRDEGMIKSLSWGCAPASLAHLVLQMIKLVF